ncbi:thiamine-phosphate kinase [Candidatus Micrarchaeota archaeon]|nr:thiamine-phosphate kinase [Candidatus Micrarchaeota archaeon]
MALSEREIIELLKKELSLPAAFEDAEAIPFKGTQLIVTTDMLSEGDDFPLGTPHYAMGWIASAANISDLGARGANPLGFLMSWGIPALAEQQIREIARGIRECADFHGTKCIGGDMNQTEKINLCGTAFGWTDKPLSRSGAREGDAIAVTGPLGATAAAYLTRWNRLEGYDGLLARFDRPIARLDLMQELNSKGLVNAAIDDSDGFAPSVHGICSESRKGALLRFEDVPIFNGVGEFAEKEKKDLLYLINMGNDYEMFMTIAEENFEEAKKVAKKHGCGLSGVGRITSGKVLIERDGKTEELPAKGFAHFSV